MKDIIVIGLNDFSKDVIKNLNNVKVILDDLTTEKEFNNINIDNISNINKYIKDNNYEIYVIDDMPYFDEIYYKLYIQDINKVNVITKESIDKIDNNILLNNNIQTYYLKDKPLLRYIEVHVSDICNLKCKGCTHFSNIAQTDEVNFSNFKDDMKLLKNNFDVSIIRLMGGEPLLKNNLDKYIQCVRNFFPKSIIFIVTNGLLIPHLKSKIIDSIKKSNVILNISLYKPTLKMIDNIKEILDKNNVKYRFGKGNIKVIENDYINKFHTCLELKKIKGKGDLKCYNQYCWFLRNKRIYKCPYPALIEILNKKFKLNYEVNNDFVDLTKIDDGWEVIKKISNRTDFCDYCRNYIKEYDWNNRSYELEDYIIGEESGNIKN